MPNTPNALEISARPAKTIHPAISYLTPSENHWACDIEADNLLDTVTKIHCVTVLNCVTKEEDYFLDRDAFSLWLSDHPDCIFVGHNFLAYDVVVLNRLWGTKIPARRIVDTFILSQLYNPTYAPPKGCRKGGHSLEAWGLRLNYPKGEFDDFSQYSADMLRYCRRDTRLTALLFRRLTERMVAVGFSEQGCELEHLAWNIIQNKQKKNGFPFDYEKAHGLYVTLRAREEELQRDIYTLWPPRLEVVKEYSGAIRKDGSHSANYTKHCGQFPRVSTPDEYGNYRAYDWVSFNLGSPAQRIEKLLALGWKPVNKTKAGNPKVDEDELIAYAELSGREEVRKLATWIVVNSRANMIRTWLDAYDEKTRAIHGRLFIASTLRYRHSNPNSANIPAVRTKKGSDGLDYIQYGEEGSYSYESRDCWYAGEEGWSLVGIDGTGIQNRCLIHGLIKTVGEDRVRPFKELALEGDVHKRNIDVLGLANKAAAKKFYYCVPLEARALTKQGWKGHDEIEVGESVLTYNKETKRQEWQPVLEKVKFDDAPVVEMGNKTFRLKSTPNHRWFVQQRKARTKWRDTPVEVRATEELTTMQNLIVNAELSEDYPASGIDWMKLPKYGTDWVSVVLQMSQQERRAFLAGFCIADGYQDGKGDWRWTQLKGPLYEGALLASYLVHDGVCFSSTRVQDNGNEIGTVILGKKPHITTNTFNYTECENQPVWCIRTENESWVMRQGDIITITGNTLMMGGGGARLAADQAQFGTKMTAKEGEAKKAALVATIPGFSELISSLVEEMEHGGRIKLCDGTPILVPSPHMVIPYLLQGDESRLMKKALILLDEELRQARISQFCLKVADIHDEWQWKVKDEYVEQFIHLALPCFNRAGAFFKYLIPIDGDAKVGKTWAETH